MKIGEPVKPRKTAGVLGEMRKKAGKFAAGAALAGALGGEPHARAQTEPTEPTTEQTTDETVPIDDVVGQHYLELVEASEGWEYHTILGDNTIDSWITTPTAPLILEALAKKGPEAQERIIEKASIIYDKNPKCLEAIERVIGEVDFRTLDRAIFIKEITTKKWAEKSIALAFATAAVNPDHSHEVIFRYFFDLHDIIKGAFEIAVKTEAENNPAGLITFLDNEREYRDIKKVIGGQKEMQDIVDVAMERDPGKVLYTYSFDRSQKNAPLRDLIDSDREGILYAAAIAKNPIETLNNDFLSGLKGTEHYQELLLGLLLAVSDKSPYDLFVNIEKFKDLDDKKILEKKLSETAVNNYVEVYQSIALDWYIAEQNWNLIKIPLEISSKHYVLDNPKVILDDFISLKEFYSENWEPWMEKTLELAFKKMAQQAPVPTLSILWAYRNSSTCTEKGWVDEILKQAAVRAAIEDTDYIESDIFFVEGMPDAILEVVARGDTVGTIKLLADLGPRLRLFLPYKVHGYLAAVIKNYPYTFLELLEKGDNSDFEDVKGFIGVGAMESLHRDAEAVKATADKGVDLPAKIIQADDLPFDRETMIKYIAGINHKSIETTADPHDSRRPREGWSLISIPNVYFQDILFSPSFQEILTEHSGEMTFMNAFSLVQATYRLLERKKEDITDAAVAEAASYILESKEKLSDHEIFGPNTSLILFTHETETDQPFDNEWILKNLYYKAGGRRDKLLLSVHGSKIVDDRNIYEQQILEAISKINGPTTILFYGHGGEDSLYLRSEWRGNEPWWEKNDDIISVEELVDALVASGHIAETNIVINACNSYIFVTKLLEFFDSHNIEGRPRIIISSSNDSRLSFGQIALKSLSFTIKSGESIKVENFDKAESTEKVWSHEDPAIWRGITPEEMEKQGDKAPPEPYLEIGWSHKPGKETATV